MSFGDKVGECTRSRTGSDQKIKVLKSKIKIFSLQFEFFF